jgi:predicted transposase/invertase (TIGR01784 family)
MAYDLLTTISQDADERARFRARRKFQMDVEHGKLISFEEGEIKGRREGKIEGKLEGKIEDAKNMLADSLPLDRIARYTGLTIERIKSLRIGD